MSTRTKKLAAGIAALVAVALGGAALAGAGPGDDQNEPGLTGATAAKAGAAALRATGGGTVNQTERDSENGATYEVEVTKAGGGQVDVRLDDQFKVVAAEPDHEDAADQPLTGATLDRASKAARAKTAGGKVTGAERDAEHGATYEVEVTKADGSEVDVRLDDQFKVVAAETDHED
jgi:uncharacterized membrane protein YkoI